MSKAELFLVGSIVSELSVSAGAKTGQLETVAKAKIHEVFRRIFFGRIARCVDCEAVNSLKTCKNGRNLCSLVQGRKLGKRKCHSVKEKKAKRERDREQKKREGRKRASKEIRESGRE